MYGMGSKNMQLVRETGRARPFLHAPTWTRFPSAGVSWKVSSGSRRGSILPPVPDAPRRDGGADLQPALLRDDEMRQHEPSSVRRRTLKRNAPSEHHKTEQQGGERMIFARTILMMVLAGLLVAAPAAWARTDDMVQVPRGQEIQAPRWDNGHEFSTLRR